MSNTKVLARRSTAFTPLLLLALALIVSFFLMGCTTQQATAADPQASQAAAPDTVAPPAPEDDGINAFGETVTYDDGLSLSVSTPAPYQPTEMAAGAVEGHTSLAFEFVLTNNSSENVEPLVFGSATSGGVEAPGVFDTSNGISFPPSTVLLPGQTIKWNSVYSVLDPADVTLQVSAGFEYDDAIFTTAAQ